MEKTKSTFDVLSATNMNAYTEKKSNLTYLSWANAWAEVKKEYPDASYVVIRDRTTEKPYFYDEHLGYMVMTEVTIDDETLEMWLPVMDGANKAMMSKPYTYKTKYGEKSVEAATMFDINKTLMRCLVKNLAMFGLGLYIYAGEDLPESEPTPTPTPVKNTSDLEDLKVGDANWNKVVAYVTANKSLGIEAIGKQLTRKYKMTAAVKKEITNLITA
jgi:hypothetical protein